MALPGRLLYTLPEAAEHLTANGHKCTIGDLIHFADIGMLEICTPVSGTWRSELNIFAREETMPDGMQFSPAPDSDCQHPFNIMSYRVPKDELATPILFISREATPDLWPENDNNTLTTFRYLAISGVMSIFTLKPMGFYEFVKYGKSPSGSFLFAAPRTSGGGEKYSRDYILLTFNSSPFDICMDDLFITADEIETLKNGGCDTGRGALSGSSARRQNATKPPAPKTVNSQARVIKALLEVGFGKDAALHPRNAIENTNSRLNIEFQKKGIKFPASGVSVEGWLKNVDD